MSERMHALAQLVLGKSSVEECSLAELQNLVKRCPYFAPAQFLLLQKLASDGSPEVEQQRQKAVLYYHDPLQFSHFLSAGHFYNDDLMLTGHEDDDLEEVTATAATESPFLQISTQNNNHLDNEPETCNADTTAQEAVNISGDAAPAYSDVDDIIPVAATGPAGISEAPISAVEAPSNKDNKDHLPEETIKPDVITTPEESQPAELAFEKPQALKEENGAPADSLARETEALQEDKIPEVTKPQNAIPADDKGPLAFEPYHTVDYFASQGIKITAEELPKDKLSKQLRSFTEWLKMMKRLPVADITNSPQSTAEKSIENMASHSVEGSEVVTEAMAEVWAKQGAREKAIETYNKLSLLNPSKNAYFATKIENLKGS